MNQDALRLARVINALRRGVSIELPWLGNGRGEVRETFSVGPDFLDGEISLLHKIDSKTRDGRIMEGRAEPSDWSLDDLMDQSAYWPPEVLEALPEPKAGEDEIVDSLIGLARDRRAVVRHWQVCITPKDNPGEDEACRTKLTLQGYERWSADEVVTADLSR